MKQEIYSDDCLPKLFRVYLPGVSGDHLEIPISVNSCLPKSLPKNVTVKNKYENIWKMSLRKLSGDFEKYVLVNGCKSIVKDEVLEFDFDGSLCFNICIYQLRTMCKRLRRSSVQSEEETKASDEVLVLDDDDFDDPEYNCADDNDPILDDDDDNDEDQRWYLDDSNNPFFPVTLNPKKRSQLVRKKRNEC